MKLVFLDWDGVLNSRTFFNAQANRATDAKILLFDYDEMLDTKAVALINQLIDKTEAKVVISSSWRINHSLEELNEILKKFGATFEAIDITPRLPEERGIEIQTYLDYVKSKGDIVDSFIVIDDDSDMAHFRNTDQFIKTTFEYGFTEWHLEQAIKVLKGN